MNKGPLTVRRDREFRRDAFELKNLGDNKTEFTLIRSEFDVEKSRKELAVAMHPDSGVWALDKGSRT